MDLIEAKNLNEPRSKRPVKHDTWHRARIISNNGNVEHWLDIKVLEYNRYSKFLMLLFNILSILYTKILEN